MEATALEFRDGTVYGMLGDQFKKSGMED